LQKAYAPLNYRVADCPVAELVAAEIISLPMFPHLTADQQATVAEEILTFTSNTPRKRMQAEENVLQLAQLTA
jgi:dTDP-4-amino-4,6-dideoxygalactose transaminase